LCEELPSVRK